MGWRRKEETKLGATVPSHRGLSEGRENNGLNCPAPRSKGGPWRERGVTALYSPLPISSGNWGEPTPSVSSRASCDGYHSPVGELSLETSHPSRGPARGALTRAAPGPPHLPQQQDHGQEVAQVAQDAEHVHGAATPANLAAGGAAATSPPALGSRAPGPLAARSRRAVTWPGRREPGSAAARRPAPGPGPGPGASPSPGLPAGGAARRAWGPPPGPARAPHRRCPGGGRRVRALPSQSRVPQEVTPVPGEVRRLRGWCCGQANEPSRMEV